MLREMIELELKIFAEFERDFSNVHKSLDQACTRLIEIGFYLNDYLITDTHFPAFGSILLNTHRNLAAATVRFTTRDYDEGMMLLRMACENARDLCTLIRNPLLFYLWERYRTDRLSLPREDWATFRKEFRFDTSNSTGKQAKWIYDQTSQIGVHGGGIITSYYRKLAPSGSHKQLNLLFVGLISLPALCKDSLQPFIREHSDLIDRKLDMSVDDFLLDLDLRYSVMEAHLLLANQELSNVVGKVNPE